ncbi:hypothetical protein [Pseudomonas panipatensis]|uniref:hypothetical protein n=1 Tax=Pseudomonas panipatensis TaxID=428992 RepID=UPI0035B18A76
MADAVTLDTFRNHANEMNDAFCVVCDKLAMKQSCTTEELAEWKSSLDSFREMQDLFEQRLWMNRGS